ncbi:hypothetical protein [Sporosarcina sp. SAFN-010]|uniref:hypothetical protein n=1 Tax=Sporosarcina sp. SAFN-010 TaxID=3387273 RepID=UPI003F7CF457
MALRKVKSPELERNQTSTERDANESSTNAHVTESVEASEKPTQIEAPKSIIPLVDKQTVKKMEFLKKFEEVMPTKTISTKGAALSIVNNKNGKRVKVATPILVELDSPNAVRFLVNEEDREVYILAAQADEVAHNLAGKPTKNVVYSAGLVERLTSLFELDYSSRTSHSIGTWTVTEEEGTKMICVRLAEEVQETPREELQEQNEEQNGTTQSSEPLAE